MRVGRELHREGGVATELRDHVGRLVLRTVVDDDHLELAVDLLLRGERLQAAPQVSGALVGRNDDGDFKRRGHGTNDSQLRQLRHEF